MKRTCHSVGLAAALLFAYSGFIVQPVHAAPAQCLSTLDAAEMLFEQLAIQNEREVYTREHVSHEADAVITDLTQSINVGASACVQAVATFGDCPDCRCPDLPACPTPVCPAPVCTPPSFTECMDAFVTTCTKGIRITRRGGMQCRN